MDLVVLEDFTSGLKGSAGHALGLTHGAVRALQTDFGIPYVVISPNTLKAFATDNGACDKAAMILAAYKRGEIEFRDDNQCDAWWLAVAGRDRTGDPLFPLPQSQRIRLDKADCSSVPACDSEKGPSGGVGTAASRLRGVTRTGRPVRTCGRPGSPGPGPCPLPTEDS